MRVLKIGDVHQTGKSPVSRLDDLPETQYSKWEEIRDIANTKDVPIISVGDVFHTAIVANSIVNRLGGILNTLNNPLYFVWGNHDLEYHSLAIWARTSLGILLQNHPMVKHISSFDKDYGISWDYIDWDRPLKKRGSKFLLSHKSIVNHRQLNSNFWIRKDKTFAKPVGDWSKGYKIILCGHWHKPYSFKHGKTTVINAGPVSRMTIEENLIPSVCLINMDTGIFKRHYLESAKPFDEVISSKHISLKSNNTDTIKKFIETIQNKDASYGSEFMGNLIRLIDSHELDPPMEKLLVDVLAKAKEKGNRA
jgi:predicted phosphodiesterase